MQVPKEQREEGRRKARAAAEAEMTGRLAGNAAAGLCLSRSKAHYGRALEVLPGGTTRVTIKRTPVPIYIDHGEGAYLADVDGNRYLDFVGNFTALIHGHAFAPVTEALSAQLARGTCYANPTAGEITLAEMLVERVPAVEKLRFANSGTEAVMFAVKGARAFTGRPKVAKLEGAYHGAYDWVEVSEASAPANWGAAEPASTRYYAGMPDSVLAETIVLPINDIEVSTRLIEHHASELACLIVDLMPSRAGLVPLEAAYVDALRKLTRKHGIVLISDEVLNFRCGFHGISARGGLMPDLVTFGKIIGGGLPIGAFGGRADIMQVFDSSKGPPAVPHGGTFAANPLSMAGGAVSLRHLTPAAFEHLEALGAQVRRGIAELAVRRGLPISITGMGSLFRLHFRRTPPRDYRQAWITPEAAALHREVSGALLQRGFMSPADTSSCCSLPMTAQDIDRFLQALDCVLDEHPELAARIEAVADHRPHEQAKNSQ